MITIPKPCREDWNNMIPADKGRFCSHCHKTVVDFTMFSDDEIKNWFYQHKDEHTCGRFHSEQLQQIQLSVSVHDIMNQPLRYRVFWIIFLVLGSMLFSCIDKSGRKSMPDINLSDTTSVRFPVILGEPVLAHKTGFDFMKMKVVPDSIYRKRKDLVEINQIIGEVVVNNEDYEEASFLNEMSLSEYISSHLKMPEGSDSTASNQVMVRFKISTDGNVTDVTVLNAGESEACYEIEAVNVISSLPAFKPAIRNGKPVEAWYEIPILFCWEEE